MANELRNSILIHFLFYIKSCLQFSLRCQPIKLWIIFFNKAQLLWCSTHQYLIVQVPFCCSLHYSLFSVSIPNSMQSILRIFPDYTWLWQRQRQIQRQTYFGARHTRAHLSWLCLALCSEPPSNCSTLLFGWADIIHSPPLCLFSTNFSLYDHLFGSPQKWGTGLLICLQIQRKICFHDKGTFHIG